jgi:hemoglobin/transferrin/lactoferrin receptor protein
MYQLSRLTRKICLLLVLIPSSIVLAEEEIKDQEVENKKEVIITATRGSISTYQAPYTVSVIDEKEIKRKQIRSLPESLAETPGVLVQKTSNGQGSPFIRGFTGYRNLALIDGVRYNNSVYRDGPNEYFSLIDINTLHSIELLNGSTSVLYGSDAIGGTLNLLSRSSNYQYETENDMFVHGSQSNRLSTAENSHISRTEAEIGKGKLWGLHVGNSYKGFGDIDAAELGTLPETGYEEHAYDARLDVNLTNKWKLTMLHQALSQDDVERTHSTIYSKSFSGSTIGTDLRRRKDQERSLSYVKLNGLDINNFIQNAILTLSYQTWDEDGDRIRSNGNRILEFFDSRMFGIDLQLESYTSFANFIYGIDFYQDNVDSGRTDFNADGSINQVRIQGPIGDDSIFVQSGLYIQAEIPVTNNLNITAGSRFNYVSADIGRYEDPTTNLAASYDDDWTSNVNSIRASYNLTESETWKLWAGVSQSFRAPNIADLSRFGASRSNETEIAATGLEPEKFLTYEIGVKARNNKAGFTSSYYYTQIDDFIASTPTGNIVGGLIEVSKQNSSSGFVQGIELSADYKFDNGFKLYGNLAWMEGDLERFTTTSSTISVTENLSRLMPLTSTFGIKWSNVDESLWFDLATTMAAKANKLSSGDIADTQRIPPGGTPAYTLVNLRGGKLVNQYLDLNIALTNLLDEAYRAHGSGTNEPGRGVTLGITAHF